jgi:uncharacterized membrane protein YphA (DoxX/SURF4 family)
MDNHFNAADSWSWYKKIFFRFICLYFFIYVVFCPNNEVEIVNFFYQPFNNLLHTIVPWVGKNILHLSYPITVFTNGSGDTTYDYVLLLIQFTLAVTGCFIWSIADRKRTGYNRMHYWLRVVLRYYLFYQMIIYGMVKIIQLQFPSEYLARLVQPYGESSPMGLAWTFLGHSYGYNLFMGCAEVLAGILLLWRRTTTLGALVSIVVTGNIVAMNYSYDIPVKLLSTHMLLMAIVLLSGDIRRVVDFFILNKAVPSVDYIPTFTTPPGIWARRLLKAAVIIFVLYANISGALKSNKKYGEGAPLAPLHGIYEVETFIKNNDTLPPLTTDSLRWKRMLIEWPGYARVDAMNSKESYLYFEPDSSLRTIRVRTEQDTVTRYTLTWREPEKNKFVLAGVLEKDTLQIRMKKIPRDSFLLRKTKFRWINEYPFNR